MSKYKIKVEFIKNQYSYTESFQCDNMEWKEGMTGIYMKTGKTTSIYIPMTQVKWVQIEESK